MKRTYYKVEDDCEVPQIFEDLDHAIEIVKELVDAIDHGYPIKITKIKMTRKEFEALPEM